MKNNNSATQYEEPTIKNKKGSKLTNALFISVISASIVASFVAAIGLSLKESDPIYSPTNPSGVKFISERTMSLSFQNDAQALTGTGWIMSKVNDDVNDLRYYVGTNLHVASALENSGRSAYTYSDSRYTNTPLPIFTNLKIGQIISKNIDGYGTYDVGVVSGKSTQFGYWSQLPISSVKVAWTTFDVFNQMNLEDPFKIYDETIIGNGTMDFAVLEIDFANRQATNSSADGVDDFQSDQNNPIKKMLDDYSANPTKFASSYKDKEAITIGGFPVHKSNGNNVTVSWETAENIYSKSTDHYFGMILDRSNWRNGIDSSIDNETIKKQYSLRLDIQYVDDNYAGYRNVANQVLFSNLNLASGSSGSMAINSNNEVVGIYWGTYNTSNQSYGTIDLFKSFTQKEYTTYKFDNLNKEYIVSKPYDIINSFNTSFPNNSLAK